MLKGFVISKHAGQLTNMAVDWKPYLRAVVEPFAPRLNMNADSLITSRVAKERLDAAQILGEMKFDFSMPAVVDALGFALNVRTNEQVFVVLYRTSEQRPLQSAYSYAQEIGLVVEVYSDAFLLFLIESLKLPLQATPAVEELKAALKYKVGVPKSEIDFDIATSYFGKFAIWRANKPVELEDLVALLCSDAGQLSVHFSDDVGDFGIGNHAKDRIVSLSTVVKSALIPIFNITDNFATSGTVVFKNGADLQDAVRLVCQGVRDVVLGPQSRAYFDYEDRGANFLCVPLSNLKDDELSTARSYLEKQGAVEVERRPSHVIAFSCLLQNSFLPSARFVNYPNLIVEDLDLERHLDLPVERLSSIFDEYCIFDISAVAEFSKWELLCFFAVEFPVLRSPFIRRPITEAAARLSAIADSPVENIYLSLSASHWKHSFLEIYRLIEGLYYFAWMHKFRTSLGSSLNEFALYKQCESDTAWSYTESASISALFELIPLSTFSDCSIQSISCLKGRFDGKTKETEVCRSFATALYSVRNSLVHQGLRNPTEVITPTGHCWESLTLALFLAAEYLYTKYPLGMPPRRQQ